MSSREMTVTCVRRDPEHGFWTARVTIAGGRTHDVDRRFGSWRVTPKRGQTAWREVPTDVARRLQDKVRPIEKRERRATAEPVAA